VGGGGNLSSGGGGAAVELAGAARVLADRGGGDGEPANHVPEAGERALVAVGARGGTPSSVV
jgi:hypothetical protein